MKRRILPILLASAMLISLSACAKCEHQWTEPTCTTAASCILCGDTEGEAAPHSFGSWDLAGEEMSRICTVCSTEERQAADYQLCLNSNIEGNWDFYYLKRGEEMVTTYSSEPGMYMRFGSEGIGMMYAPEPQNGIITEIGMEEFFAGFMSFNEQERCFSLILESMNGHLFPTELYLADGLFSDIMRITLDTGIELLLTRNEAENKGLSGTWAAERDGTLYSLELMPDGVLNIRMGDVELQGIWSAMPATPSEGEIIGGFNIIYPEGETYDYSGDLITLCEEDGDVEKALNAPGHRVVLELYDKILTFTKLPPEEAEK